MMGGRGARSSSSSETDRQALRDAVEYYASGDGMWVNQSIRRGERLSDEDRELVRELDEATRLDEVTVPKLYRSVDAESVFGEMSQLDYENLSEAYIYGDEFAARSAQHIMDRAQPGKRIVEKGFMSTSEDYDVVADWYDFTGSDKPITLELEVPRGTRGCKVYEMTPEAEARDPQREVLLPRGVEYRIKNITSRDGLVYVQAEIV